jgi:hypothetical protein
MANWEKYGLDIRSILLTDFYLYWDISLYLIFLQSKCLYEKDAFYVTKGVDSNLMI